MSVQAGWRACGSAVGGQRAHGRTRHAASPGGGGGRGSPVWEGGCASHNVNYRWPGARPAAGLRGGWGGWGGTRPPVRQLYWRLAVACVRTPTCHRQGSTCAVLAKTGWPLHLPQPRAVAPQISCEAVRQVGHGSGARQAGQPSKSEPLVVFRGWVEGAAVQSVGAPTDCRSRPGGQDMLGLLRVRLSTLPSGRIRNTIRRSGSPSARWRAGAFASASRVFLFFVAPKHTMCCHDCSRAC